MYRDFSIVANEYKEGSDSWISEAYKEGCEYIYGYGKSEKESLSNIKKNIDDYLDLYG